jgi:prepilin-type processing-associated H-X9-DG protein/prepilin-type N-terminal cleavage/methylation domain-containing protein
MPARSRHAFTLVELLVVIGIIALLIGILLPTLNRARQAASRTACAAKLHQIVLAAELHRSDHAGYYPLVGVLPGFTPDANLNDEYARNYDYFSYAGAVAPRELAPITDSLATEMNFKAQMLSPTNSAGVAYAQDPTYFIRNFLCPSQASSVENVINGQAPENFCLYAASEALGSAIFKEAQSYIYNEAVLGFNDSLGRLRGHAGQVHQPAMTMFAADGLHGRLAAETSSCALFTLYNNHAAPPITMGDALSGNPLANDPACFDLPRHQGRINIAFCDGHVETRTISVNDLKAVFLLPP